MVNLVAVYMLPLNTDNPVLKLTKRIDGDVTELGSNTPTFSTNEWFKMTMIRDFSGSISVYINDVLQIDVIDTTYLSPGYVCFLAWENRIYIDDFCYIPKVECNCDFYDGFEDGTINGWTSLTGNYNLSQTTVYSGSDALELYDTSGYGSCISNQNNFSFGTYSFNCYVQGWDADGYIRFFYIDNSNFYQLTLNPQGSDNPKLVLSKRISGVVTELFNIQPIFSLENWFSVSIERSTDFKIKVFVNNLLQGTVIDSTYADSGYVCLMSYHDAFFDDFCYKAGTYQAVNPIKPEISKIFPVPSDNYIEIQTAKQISTLRITDVTGMTLKTTAFINKPVDIVFLKPGIYFAELFNREGNRVSSLKFIKN